MVSTMASLEQTQAFSDATLGSMTSSDLSTTLAEVFAAFYLLLIGYIFFNTIKGVFAGNITFKSWLITNGRAITMLMVALFYIR